MDTYLVVTETKEGDENRRVESAENFAEVYQRVSETCEDEQITAIVKQQTKVSVRP